MGGAYHKWARLITRGRCLSVVIGGKMFFFMNERQTVDAMPLVILNFDSETVASWVIIFVVCNLLMPYCGVVVLV